MYCEDYPCCGHTDADPCSPQWYDAPDAFDPSVNPHCFCDHSDGWCEVDDFDDDDSDDDYDDAEPVTYAEYGDWY